MEQTVKKKEIKKGVVQQTNSPPKSRKTASVQSSILYQNLMQGNGEADILTPKEDE